MHYLIFEDSHATVPHCYTHTARSCSIVYMRVRISCVHRSINEISVSNFLDYE